MCDSQRKVLAVDLDVERDAAERIRMVSNGSGVVAWFCRDTEGVTASLVRRGNRHTNQNSLVPTTIHHEES